MAIAGKARKNKISLTNGREILACIPSPHLELGVLQRNILVFIWNSSYDPLTLQRTLHALMAYKHPYKSAVLCCFLRRAFQELRQELSQDLSLFHFTEMSGWAEE